MTTEIRLVIADDHPVFRRGLRMIIEADAALQVVAEAEDGARALDRIKEAEPDVAVLDVDMPQGGGFEVVLDLQKLNLHTEVIFLTMYKDEDVFNAALDAGVKGYVLKENAAEDIIAALLKVAEGETFYSAGLAAIGRRRDDRVKSLLLNKPQIDTLTPAEKRILKLIAEDRTSKEIADVLGISFKTVENHRLNICNKLNIHGSHSLLKFAFDHKSYL